MKSLHRRPIGSSAAKAIVTAGLPKQAASYSKRASATTSSWVRTGSDTRSADGVLAAERVQHGVVNGQVSSQFHRSSVPTTPSTEPTARLPPVLYAGPRYCSSDVAASCAFHGRHPAVQLGKKRG